MKSDTIRASLTLKRKITALVFPVVVFGVIIASTLYFASIIESFLEKRSQELFNDESELVIAAIESRTDLYVNALQAGVALFDASQEVTREDWREFVDSLNLQSNFPGLQGYGYSLQINPDDLESHIEQIRSEGFPEYSVKPEGERDVYTSIVFLEPFDLRNQQAFGFDMFQQETRQAAMLAARDTGEPRLSGRVTLVQEIDQDVQAGFLIYVPQYANDSSLLSSADRQVALEGYVYSPFRARDFMDGILGDRVLSIDFAAYDTDTHAFDDDLLLFDSRSRGLSNLTTNDIRNDRKQTQIKMVELAGRTWSILFSADKLFGIDSVERNSIVFIQFAGAAFGLLIAAVIYILSLSRERAMSMAIRMTDDLRKSSVEVELKAKENEKIRTELEKANNDLVQKTKTLEHSLTELEKTNKLMMGREKKMAELKRNIKNDSSDE